MISEAWTALKWGANFAGSGGLGLHHHGCRIRTVAHNGPECSKVILQCDGGFSLCNPFSLLPTAIFFSISCEMTVIPVLEKVGLIEGSWIPPQPGRSQIRPARLICHPIVLLWCVSYYVTECAAHPFTIGVPIKVQEYKD